LKKRLTNILLSTEPGRPSIISMLARERIYQTRFP
jgi:hypothetical protein